MLLMLGLHCRFSSIDSESHQQSEECRQVQPKTPRSKKVDDSLVDEVEHVLLLIAFVDRSIEFNFRWSVSLFFNI